MDLIQHITQFLEENPSLSIKQKTKKLKEMKLVPEELPITLRVGDLEGGGCRFYTLGKEIKIKETRPGLIFQELLRDKIVFMAPDSPLTLPYEIERASLKGDQWDGRYGGHADANLRLILKRQEKFRRESGELNERQYQLSHKKQFTIENPGFDIFYREPPAYDNSLSRHMLEQIRRGIPGYGSGENRDDYPDAKLVVPILYAGIKTLEFYYKNAIMFSSQLNLRAPEQQDLFLENVVNAVYQLPICMQHVEMVLGKKIAVSV